MVKTTLSFSPADDPEAAITLVVQRYRQNGHELADAEAIEIELSPAEALSFGKALVGHAESWYDERRRDMERHILEHDEDKQQAIMWLQQEKWCTDDPNTKFWLYSQVVHFDGDPIEIERSTRLGAALETLPEGHVIAKFFVRV